jgi:hypothetical protein
LTQKALAGEDRGALLKNLTDYELQSTSYPPENQSPLYGLLWRKLFTESNAAPHQTVLWLSPWHGCWIVLHTAIHLMKGDRRVRIVFVSI